MCSIVALFKNVLCRMVRLLPCMWYESKQELLLLPHVLLCVELVGVGVPTVGVGGT